MGLFDIFKKKKADAVQEKRELAPDERYNKLWQMWEKKLIPSPYREIMLYKHEVDGHARDGHLSYFLTLRSAGNVEHAARTVIDHAPSAVAANLEDALRAYKNYYGVDDENMKEILEECDFIYCGCADELTAFLKEYAQTVEM